MVSSVRAMCIPYSFKYCAKANNVRFLLVPHPKEIMKKDILKNFGKKSKLAQNVTMNKKSLFSIQSR